LVSVLLLTVRMYVGECFVVNCAYVCWWVFRC